MTAARGLSVSKSAPAPSVPELVEGVPDPATSVPELVEGVPDPATSVPELVEGPRIPRRIVTGHDAAGVSIVVSDGPLPVTRELPDDGGAFHEVWVTDQAPAVIRAGAEDPTAGALTVPPPVRGTRIRVNEFLPGHLDEHGRQSPVHRTESIDYGIVLEGEITLILDDSEVVARAGDIVVQRGTAHAWANRTDAVARVAFVLLDGEFGQDLLDVLPVDVRDGLMRHGPREPDAGGAA